MTERPPAVPDLADRLLVEAIEHGASDLHLDPTPTGFSTRLRVDGRFVRRNGIGTEDGRRLIGRLKVLADLLAYRSDIPQEGRLALPGGREARLAIIPTVAGEKATVRLFDSDRRLGTLDRLGLEPGTLRWLRRRLAADRGLLLVVGPSGSGKTSTLYAAMAEIAARRGDFCHLTSIEDPVERRLEGCSQVQVHAGRGLDFAAGLKFLLRQDPEVVMVGEIRDAETARIAVRAAMTGHLVLSSMHCGWAEEARPRLLEMGVERYAADLALLGVVAQRLLRKLCNGCHGTGCDACLDTGYRGRVVVTEHLDGTDDRCATTLLDAAKRQVAAGITTTHEVARVFGGRS